MKLTFFFNKLKEIGKPVFQLSTHWFGNNCKEGIKNAKYIIQYSFIENNSVSSMIVPRYYLNSL